MTLIIPKPAGQKLTLAKPTGASWRITPAYTLNYPTSPTNGQTYSDPNTGITWTYSTATSSWSEP